MALGWQHTLSFVLCSAALALAAARTGVGQQAPVQFGGSYSGLDARQQQIVQGWVTRFSEVTGQPLKAEPFYDDILSFSTKTTFEAVTHALTTTRLTDESGAPLGDALALVERVESVRGEIAGASGDRQFRMYVRLKDGAIDTLERSRQFRRGVDNTVYHKGFPINYREQGGVPSIQVSIALDRRRADIDVDYRASSFPVSMFNGHLTAANSDVRAGDNYSRHINRWTGFQNWWRSFFGIRLTAAPDDSAKDKPLLVPNVPRAGRKDIDLMVHDFLQAWLVEGDVVAAMGYVSDRSYACLARDADDPTDFDRGMAPFQIMINMKAAHDAVGARTSLEGLTVGVRLTARALKVVRQPHHAQVVIYSVPDDVAAGFDCESQLTPREGRKPARVYGQYYGAMFNIKGHADHRVELLWARQNGYWKIVSWRAGGDDRDAPVPDAPAVPPLVHIKADASLAQAAHGFLDSWLIKKDYDAAFRYLSAKSYACYDLGRGPDAPPSTSPDDAGRKIRTALEQAGRSIGTIRRLDDAVTAPVVTHPLFRLMDHPYSRAFTLTSPPNVLVAAVDCQTRAQNGSRIPAEIPAEYGAGYGMTLRFLTRGGEAPVLRLLWIRENGEWRITAYDVDMP